VKVRKFAPGSAKGSWESPRVELHPPTKNNQPLGMKRPPPTTRPRHSETTERPPRPFGEKKGKNKITLINSTLILN